MAEALLLLSCPLLWFITQSDKFISRIDNSAGTGVLLRDDRVKAPVHGTRLGRVTFRVRSLIAYGKC